MRRKLLSVLVAAMVVLAGCSAAPGGGGSDGEGGSGTVNMYISDQPSAIDDFSSLEVTVTSVGFHRTGDDNGTEAGDDDGTEMEDDGGWVERDINDTTVDLTELRGENATLLEEMALPNGTYNKVFIHVSEVNGTLTDGESVNVKLPSDRLQLNERFTVGDGGEVDFVYDVNVVKAGGSGKYIIKPVASESGTDVPIRETSKGRQGGPDPDDRGQDRDGDENRGGDGGDDESGTETADGTESGTATPTESGTETMSDGDDGS